REEYFLNVLEDFKVQDIMLTDPQVINENMKFSEIINYISTTKHNCFPVVNEENILIGVLKYEEIRQFVFEEGLVDIVVAGELCDKKIPPVAPNDSIAHAIKIMSFSNEEILPVVNNLKERKLLGIITRKDIISYYNKISLEQENTARLEF
ncbi:MAG: CBS domain-containing protein, partial [Deferribacterota bacterium]|nr:CBS domain-containing protein [Deferribacterota bacterium]